MPTADNFGERQARRFLERKGYDRASLHLYRPHKWALNPKPKWIPGYSEAGRRAPGAQGSGAQHAAGWVGALMCHILHTKPLNAQYMTHYSAKRLNLLCSEYSGKIEYEPSPCQGDSRPLLPRRASDQGVGACSVRGGCAGFAP